MATREEIFTAIRNADKAGDSDSVQKLAAYLQTMQADSSASSALDQQEKPGGFASLGAGLGKGFGQVVLNAQKYAGKGLSALGGIGQEKTLSDLIAPTPKNPIQSAGDWLVNDANRGLANISEENAPYKAAHPFINGTGEVGGQVVATMPVGGILANVASSIPKVSTIAPNLLSAIRTGGMSAGQAAPGVGNAILNLATRSAGGAITGGASAALVDPEQGATGAAIGGILPVATKVAGVAGKAVGDGIANLADSAAKRLMQSAIKPTIAQLRTGEADTAAQTLLDYGINPTKEGVNKLRALIDAKNSEISTAIGSSGATVDKQNVLQALAGVRQKFGNQVSPTGDLASIQGVADDFAAHPNLPTNDIPVQTAQEMKQGTYRVLSGKYGQIGSAETEAQKALARGLKDEIATAVPGVGPLNAEESRLLTTLSVAERRALMEMNKNPMGLAALAHNPISWAAFMADRSAAFKALAARAVNQMSSAPNTMQGLLGNQVAQQLGYQAAPVALSGR